MKSDLVSAHSPEKWRRNLSILWVAQFIGMFGMSGILPFLAVYVRELGVHDIADAKSWTGLLYSAPFFTVIPISPVWGYLGDRYGQKPMLMRALGGVALALALMGMVTSVEQLMVVRLLQGLVSGFIVAGIAFVAKETPAEHTGYALGVLQSSVSSGTILGPLLGGLMSDMFGMRSMFFIVAALLLLSTFIVLVGIDEDHAPIVGPDGSRTPSMFRAMGSVMREGRLRSIVLLLFLAQFAVMFTPPLMAFVVEGLGVPAQRLATVTGIMVGLTGVCALLATPLWGRQSDKRGYMAVIRLIVPLAAITTLLHALAPDIYTLGFLRMVLGFSGPALLPVLYAELSRRSPAESRSSIISFSSSAVQFGMLIAPIFGGWLASSFGLGAAFVFAALVLMVLGFSAEREDRASRGSASLS